MATNKTHIFYFLTIEDDEEFKDFIEAEDLVQARLSLEDRKVKFRNLHQAGLLDFEIDLTFIFGVSQSDLLHMTRFFGSLLKAGVPIVRTLELVKFNTINTTLKRSINSMLWRIQRGYNITESFKQDEHLFPRWYIHLIQIGEESGELVKSLNRIGFLLERQIELKRKILKALLYPSFTLLVSFALVFYLLVAIVPRFKEMYSRFGQSLPVPTQVLISTSDLVLHNYNYLIGLVMAICIFFLAFRKTEFGKAIWNFIQLDLPLIGPIFLTYNTALFSKNLGTLISSGVPIMAALQSVGEATDNFYFSKNITNARRLVEEGKGLGAALKSDRPVLPKLAINMIDIGEEAGSLSDMLENVSEFYNEQVEEKIGVLTTAIEPILLVFLGLIIGGIVISLYLPIFGLAKMIGGQRH